MLMTFLNVCKIVEYHQAKYSITSLIFILMFSKELHKVYSDFKDRISNLSNKFDVGIVYVFKVVTIKKIKIFLFIRSNMFSFKFVVSIFWQFFCCLHFSLKLDNYFHFFPTRINKFKTKKKHVGR